MGQDQNYVDWINTFNFHERPDVFPQRPAIENKIDQITSPSLHDWNERNRAPKMETAISDRDLDKLQMIFKEDPSLPTVLLKREYFPICFAIDEYSKETKEDLAIIQFFLDIDPTDSSFSRQYDRWHTPLNHAIMYRRWKIFQLLLHQRPTWVTLDCKIDDNPFLFAAGCRGSLDFLIALIHFRKPKMDQLIGMLGDDGNRTSLLHEASRRHRWPTIEFLLWLGADPLSEDKNGQIPFYLFVTHVVWYDVGTSFYLECVDKWKALLGREVTIPILDNLKSNYQPISDRLRTRFASSLEEDFILKIRFDTYFARSLTARLLLEL